MPRGAFIWSGVLRVVMCGEECADIRNVIIVVIINTYAPRAPVAGRWWNSKGRDNAANFAYEPGALLITSACTRHGCHSSNQANLISQNSSELFVAAGRTHLIRKRTGRSMMILCRDVMLINRITIIIDYLLL